MSLLEYFRLQKAWDRKERVASADVVLLKEAQGRYAERNFEQLYDRWRKGSAEDWDVLRVAERPFEAARVVFGALVCGSSLTIFTDPLGITPEDSPEPESRDSLSEVPAVGPFRCPGDDERSDVVTRDCGQKGAASGTAEKDAFRETETYQDCFWPGFVGSFPVVGVVRCKKRIEITGDGA